MLIITIVLLSVSLCADCFAVSLCSSVTLRKIEWKNVIAISLSFAVIQTGLYLAGWGFGSLLLGLVMKIADIIGFLLLLYVGGSMLVEGIRGTGAEARDLNGLQNVLIGGVATSIDAMAVGVSMSMDAVGPSEALWQSLALFVCTMVSVIAGILGGKVIGTHAGRIAEIAGGIVLIVIGVGVLM